LWAKSLIVPEAGSLHTSAQNNNDKGGILTNAADDTLLAEALELGGHGSRGNIALEGNQVGDETSNVRGGHGSSRDAIGGLECR